jgi:hypothetical protein
MADEQPNDGETTTPTDIGSGTPLPSQPRRTRVSAKAERPPGSEPGTTEPTTDVPVVIEDPDIVPEGHLELVERGAHDVTVGTLSIRQGGVNNARARSIDVRQGGISRAEGGDIAVTQGGIAFARGERVSVEMGAVALAVGGDVTVTQGYAQSILARDVRIEQGGARTVIASRATFGRNSGAFMVIAGKVDGEIRALLDWRAALAFGAAFGLVVGLARRARR